MKTCTKCKQAKPETEFYDNQRGKRCWCKECCKTYYSSKHYSSCYPSHPLHRTWSDMKQRCFNPNCNNYKRYGKRGITVCEEWLSFKPFEEWCLANGWQKGLTIDRIDNDGNYEPSNCQFITKSENTRKSKHNIISAN